MCAVLTFRFNSTNSGQDQMHEPHDSGSDAGGTPQLLTACLCCYSQAEGTVVISTHTCYFARQGGILMCVHYNYF